MYPILGTSLVAVTAALERCLFFARIRSDEAAMVRGAEEALLRSGLGPALGAARKGRGPVRDVVEACLGAWEAGPEVMEDMASLEGSRAAARMDKRLGWLSVVVVSAPLLGLLGTVLGMIEVFMQIENAGGEVRVDQLAGGIWEALLTTAFGLIVAIPAQLAHHFFDGKVNHLTGLMREAGERLVLLRRKGGRA
jgi:biopolymer transport protein ExbB